MTAGREKGPLVLGATGRLGRAFRRLAADGFWPGPVEPLWQERRTGMGGNALVWDFMTDPPPDDPRLRVTRGVIVLAGVTAGTDVELTGNTSTALRAIALARELDLGPVLLCSSAGVYGRAPTPRAEHEDCTPATPYGASKLAMEKAVAGQGATCLRIANVAGSDMLFAGAARGGMTLDQFPDGAGPVRAYIGPRTLAATMLRLIALADRSTALPPILNIAAPRPVAMEAILAAAGVTWAWVPAPATALASVTMNTALLRSLAPLAPDSADPGTLVAEARAAGWGTP